MATVVLNSDKTMSKGENSSKSTSEENLSQMSPCRSHQLQQVHSLMAHVTCKSKAIYDWLRTIRSTLGEESNIPGHQATEGKPFNNQANGEGQMALGIATNDTCQSAENTSLSLTSPKNHTSFHDLRG